MVTRNGHTNDQEGVIQGFDLEKTDLASTLQNTLKSRFAGMEVDPATQNMMNFLLYQFVPYASEQVEKHGVKFLRDTAITSGITKDLSVANTIGKKYAPLLAYATVLAEPIISLGASAYDATNRVNDLRKALTPISKSNHKFASVEAIFGSNNEVVQNARGKIYSNLYADFTGVLARSIVSIPMVMAIRGRAHERAKLQAEEVDLELAHSDPKKLEEYILKQVKGGSSVHTSVEDLKFKQIKEMREAYHKEFETYKNGTEGKKALDEITKRFASDREFARQAGVEHLFFERGEEYKPRHDFADKDARREAFRRNSSLVKDNPELERQLDKQLKYRFVEDVKYGKAFDHTWVESKLDRYGRRIQDERKTGPSTVEESIEHVYSAMQDKLLGKKAAAEQELKGHGGKDSGVDIMNQMLAGVAAIAGTQLDKLFVGDKRKELNKPIAMELIMHLKKVLEESPGAGSIPNLGERAGDSSYVKYVHEVFQQHQMDCKKAEIGERYFDKLKASRFDDEAIFQMRDEDLSAYEVAIKHIARALKEGQMDAAALINLVGQRKIVQKDGKHFGPKGSDSKKEGVLEEINKQCACIAAHKELSGEQLSELLSNLVFTEEDIKAGFAANGAFKGEERAFLFALLDAQIKDVEAMKKLTGLGESEMANLRKQSASHFAEHFDAAIATIAGLSNEELSHLAKHEITPDEITLIRQAAASMQQSGKHVNDLANGEAKHIQTFFTVEAESTTINRRWPSPRHIKPAVAG